MGELTPATSSAPAGLLAAGIALGAAGAEGQGYITLFPICHCSYLSPPHGTRAAAPAAGTAGAGGDAEGRRSSGCSEAAVFRRQRERSPAAVPGRDLCLPSASPGSCRRGRAAGDVVRVWPPMRGGGVLLSLPSPASPREQPGDAGAGTASLVPVLSWGCRSAGTGCPLAPVLTGECCRTLAERRL